MRDGGSVRIFVWLFVMAGTSYLIGQQRAKTGPEVGARVPSFEAPDQNGRLQSLKTIAGPKGAMLVFFRSADWLPYCKSQLVELERDVATLRKQGIGVAAISYDSVAILKNFTDRRGISYPLLADPDSRIIRAFGILNETVDKNAFAYGIPHPGTYIVDRNGVVKSKYFEDDYRERDTASEILVREFGIQPGLPQAAIETKHLKLSTAASAASVRQGHHIALTIDLDLNPKMHVYAPGVQGYIPIDWGMAESKAVRVAAVAYPASKKLHLKPINETVPVYQGKFRLVRELTIGPEADVKPLLTPGGELVLSGILRYQACDDKECYLPQTVPLKWTLPFESLDRERAPVELQRKEGR